MPCRGRTQTREDMPGSDDLDEEELIDRIAQGDQDAFQALFGRLAGNVFKLSYSLLLDRQMAEDATQETFVKLWLRAADWRPEATLKTWLLTIARNLCLDMIRKQKNDLRKRQNLFDGGGLDVVGPVQAHAENEVDRKKQKEALQVALFQLPARQREAIVLVYFMEVPNSEAARIVGLKVAAFDSLLARARRSLREVLSRADGAKGHFDGYH